MSESPQHTHKPSALAFIGWLILAGGTASGMWLLYQKIEHPPAIDISVIEKTLAEQATELAALRASLEQSTQAVTPDPNIAVMAAELTALREQLSALQQTQSPPPVPLPNNAARRLLTLQHNVYQHVAFSAELEAIAALESAKPVMEAIDILRPFAAKGMPHDGDLRAEFDRLSKNTTPPNPPTTALGGLITIKRRAPEPTPADTISTLSIAELADYVRALPETERAQYGEWLARIEARDAAYSALQRLHHLLVPTS